MHGQQHLACAAAHPFATAALDGELGAGSASVSPHPGGFFFFFFVPVHVAGKLGAGFSEKKPKSELASGGYSSRQQEGGCRRRARSRCDVEPLMKPKEPRVSGQERKAKSNFLFFFHLTDPTRAEINKNEFPAHFICGMMMDLEANVSVHGTDIERETSRTALGGQNAEILQITAIYISYQICQIRLSNSILRNMCQPFILTLFVLPLEPSGCSKAGGTRTPPLAQPD